MEHVRLGKSGMMVTKLGFGGIPIQRLDETTAVKVIRHAFDSGIDWVDTANGYGTSEERIGKALAHIDRGKVKVFSKAAARTAEQLEEQVETSFQRMSIDVMDLYQFHIVPDAEAWETMQQNGAFDVLRRYRDKGRIRHIGASAHTVSAIEAILEHPEIEVIQWPFNFIVIDDGRKILEKTKEKNVGFIAMKPFCGGVVDNARLCIAFQMQYPSTVADPGFESIAEVTEVVEIANKAEPLTAEEQKTLARLREEMGAHFCRRCGYCSPCPQNVSIIALMTMDSLIKRFSRESVINGWIGDSARSAEKCTDCGLCEEKCPYKLPIRQQIKKGAQLFEDLGTEAVQPE